MDLNQLFENNNSWVFDKLNLDKNYFEKLSKGQSPQILYFGCSDSRIIPEVIMGMEPGDVFVHRNISNIVSDSDLNSMSVLHFAIEQLKINQIIVCGHYDCGGIKEVLQSSDHGYLNHWLKNVMDVFDSNKEELDTIHSEKEKQHRLAELNVLNQCMNIQNSEIIKKGSKEREIQIYGWIFDIYSGKLLDLNFSSNN